MHFVVGSPFIQHACLEIFDGLAALGTRAVRAFRAQVVTTVRARNVHINDVWSIIIFRRVPPVGAGLLAGPTASPATQAVRPSPTKSEGTGQDGGRNDRCADVSIIRVAPVQSQSNQYGIRPRPKERK